MALVHKGEPTRGCGQRKYKGLYLVSDPGINLPCKIMPWPIMPCECCGMSPAVFGRSLQWIRPRYFQTPCDNKKCPAQGRCAFTAPPSAPCARCDGQGYVYATPLDAVAAGLGIDEADKRKCRVCRGRGHVENLVGLMWVGTQYYTAESFMTEAHKLGVSKRIPANQVPKDLRLGQSWVMLAIHNHMICPKCGGQDEDCLTCGGKKLPAVFYAFQPTRLEMILKDEDVEERQEWLEANNITPVIVTDDDLVDEEEEGE